jgi:hypothetical protein
LIFPPDFYKPLEQPDSGARGAAFVLIFYRLFDLGGND